MRGPRVFKMARRRIREILDVLYEETGVSEEQVALVVPHQASGPALASAPSYGISVDKVVNVIAEYGNCVAASIPIALSVAHREGRLHRGDLVLLGGTSAGLSVGFALLRW
jgi:3-oxoacyl-[acyl-carrier-protein] synthase-3